MAENVSALLDVVPNIMGIGVAIAATCDVYSECDTNPRIEMEDAMSRLVDYENTHGDVRDVFDDIMQTRKTDWVNNFWRALAVHPKTLKRIWFAIKEVMAAPSHIDPVTKEMIYVAVSITNNCRYCIASHTSAALAKGLSEEQLAELRAIVALANETNRLAIAYDIPVDAQFADI